MAQQEIRLILCLQKSEEGTESVSYTHLDVYKRQYYGSMKDKYVVKLEIKSKKKVQDMDVADRVTVQLMYTDPNIRARKQIVKTSEKEGLYLSLIHI